MKNAGRAVADIIAARFSPCAVAVLCGPGNNGGDGFVVARLLAALWLRVRGGEPGRTKGDAATMAVEWRGRQLPLTPAALEGAALIVDALFGAGLSRPLVGGDAHVAADAVEHAHVPVVAVDMPSGVDGDNGQVWAASRCGPISPSPSSA